MQKQQPPESAHVDQRQTKERKDSTGSSPTSRSRIRTDVIAYTTISPPCPSLSPLWSNKSVTNPFDIGNVPVGRGQLFLIAGPCVLESETHARTIAEAIQRIAADLGLPYIFKASYDKANRTSIRSFRGPGLIEGARILRAIAQSTGLPILTDVHTPEDCPRLSDALGPAEAGAWASVEFVTRQPPTGAHVPGRLAPP